MACSMKRGSLELRGLLSRPGFWAFMVLVAGTIARLGLAPYTSGSDVPQFAGFADTFLRHGLSFYSYSDGGEWYSEGWPYGWPYVYGPLFIVVLGLLRLVARGEVYRGTVDGNYVVYVPGDWLLAFKLFLIFFDALAGLLVYLLARRLTGSGWRALGALAFYYLNPMVYYITAIYGMFDQVSLAFLLAAVLLYTVRGGVVPWVLAGLGVAVKPTILIALPPLFLWLWSRRGAKEAAVMLVGVLGVPLALMAPFVVADPGGVGVYLAALGSVSSPSYIVPVVYSFNGLYSIAFYAWNHAGVDASYILSKWPLLFAPLYALALYVSTRSPGMVEPLALGYGAYLASYWRVNHQYLVPWAAFTALLIAVDHRFKARLLAAASNVLSGLWVFLYPVSFWAHVHIREPNEAVVRVLSMASLNVYDDLVYVYDSLALTLSIVALVCTLAGYRISGGRHVRAD